MTATPGAQRLDGKVAIVTGAARGSGEAIARLFAAEGATVVLADMRVDLAEKVAADIGGGAMAVACDVGRADAWAYVMVATQRAHGRIDVLVNNAGLLHMAPIVDTTVADYERIWRVNELGVFLGIKTIAPVMAENGGGSIVNISSIDGLYVAPFTGAYAATKFAVRGLTKTAALELGRQGIRVNAVCPAAGNPQMVVDALPEPLRKALVRDDGTLRAGHATPPVGRHGTTEDVAYAALYLASDESGYLTGTELVLDGGETAGIDIMARMTPRPQGDR